VELIKWADAFVLATGGYHPSMSGSREYFLDYFWSEVAGKNLAKLLLHVRKRDSNARCLLLHCSKLATNGTMSSSSICLLSFLVLFSRLCLRGFVIIFSN
jgi:hypothetical protein